MAQIDYRELPVRELYLYMNLVTGFCSDSVACCARGS